MRIDVYGTFLITGETLPLDLSSRLVVETRVRKVLTNNKPPARTAAVTLADAIDEGGQMHKRCKISVRFADGYQCEQVGVGRTNHEALIAACGLLSRRVEDVAALQSEAFRRARRTAQDRQRCPHAG